ncbi:MAG: DUF4936 family protein [Gammaproteobacteria bacterium]|uniref:DUF4936 family protein n=1 Tax=Azohydromonas sp. TaxID=1872666 RepID=UPI002C70FA96|nr:DUF4936 family protein [Azohydromonas sp.]HMM85977.1 DUF4936 family protein [Azohydromonas sp.]
MGAHEGVGGARLYVYYRVAPDLLPAAFAAVRDLQYRLASAHAGLRCALFRRPQVAGEPVTLMETYAAPGGVDDALVRRIEAAARALPPGRLGERHVELFEPCD